MLYSYATAYLAAETGVASKSITRQTLTADLSVRRMKRFTTAARLAARENEKDEEQRVLHDEHDATTTTTTTMGTTLARRLRPTGLEHRSEEAWRES